MAKYKIRAHYHTGTVILGTVEAADKNHALTVAEQMGLLDDEEAVDWTATLVQQFDLKPQT